MQKANQMILFKNKVVLDTCKIVLHYSKVINNFIEDDVKEINDTLNELFKLEEEFFLSVGEGEENLDYCKKFVNKMIYKNPKFINLEKKIIGENRYFNKVI